MACDSVISVAAYFCIMYVTVCRHHHHCKQPRTEHLCAFSISFRLDCVLGLGSQDRGPENVSGFLSRITSCDFVMEQRKADQGPGAGRQFPLELGAGPVQRLEAATVRSCEGKWVCCSQLGPVSLPPCTHTNRYSVTHSYT